jgi:hypothetical protein
MQDKPRSYPDLLTVAASGVIVYVLALTLHEVVGHLLPIVALGGRPALVATTDLRGDWGQLTATQLRWVAAGGSLVNLLTAILCGVRLRRREGLDGKRRYFLWLLMTVSAYMPGSYLIASPILGVGDWAVFVSGLEPAWQWQALLVGSGLAICLIATRVSLAELEPFLSATQPERRDRANVLTRLPYVAGGVVACAAAVPSPLGFMPALAIAGSATFGATWWIFCMPWFVRQPLSSARSLPPVAIIRSRSWLVAGIFAAIGYIGILGPGIRLSP